MVGAVDYQRPGSSSAYANSTQSCRPREALLSSGPLCLKNGTPFWGKRKHRVFQMKRLRIASALAGTALCALGFALLWPHARDAGRVLAARDDPAELSDLQLNSALRTAPAGLVHNIEAALAAGDADLASSFVELAGQQNIPLDDELTGRVNDAVA